MDEVDYVDEKDLEECAINNLLESWWTVISFNGKNLMSSPNIQHL